MYTNTSPFQKNNDPSENLGGMELSTPLYFKIASAYVEISIYVAVPAP